MFLSAQCTPGPFPRSSSVSKHTVVKQSHVSCACGALLCCRGFLRCAWNCFAHESCNALYKKWQQMAAMHFSLCSNAAYKTCHVFTYKTCAVFTYKTWFFFFLPLVRAVVQLGVKCLPRMQKAVNLVPGTDVEGNHAAGIEKMEDRLFVEVWGRLCASVFHCALFKDHLTDKIKQVLCRKYS